MVPIEILRRIIYKYFQDYMYYYVLYMYVIKIILPG